MTTLVLSDQCSKGHQVCVHNECTYLTVQKLWTQQIAIFSFMYSYTELRQQHIMVAEVLMDNSKNGYFLTGQSVESVTF